MSDPPKIKLQNLDVAAHSLARLLPMGQVLTNEMCLAIAETMLKCGRFYDDTAPRSVSDTLGQYIGKTLDSRVVSLISRQLAARKSELLIGPLPAISHVLPGWAAFEITQAKPVPWKDTDLGHMLTLFTLSGSMAGMTFSRKFPDRWLRGLAYNIGFSRKFVYPDEGKFFIGLRVWGSVTPSERDPRQPEFQEIVVTAKVKTGNKAILKCRMRFDLTCEEDPCPYEYQDDCADCKKTSTACPASFIRVTHA